MNVPANITKLINISEKGQVVKERPRYVFPLGFDLGGYQPRSSDRQVQSE
jgi:hypothetical protein